MTTNRAFPLSPSLSAVVASCLILSACGGGGGSSTSTGGVTSATTTPAAAKDLVLNGVVATGAAVANANVEANCALGRGTAVSATDGSYRIVVANGQLPCVFQALSADNSLKLKSVLETSSNSALTANITPFTDLIVAHLDGTLGVETFTQVAQQTVALSPAAIADAKLRIQVALNTLMPFGTLDPVKDVLVAKSPGIAGNAHDALLDTFRDKLAAARMSVAEARETVIKSPQPILAEVLKTSIQPNAIVCEGLRSGQYRLIEPANVTAPVRTITFDAVQMKATVGQSNLTLKGDSCQLSISDGSTLVMSASGLGMIRTASNTVAVVMPMQTLSISDLKGTWNYIAREKEFSTPTHKAGWGEFVLDSLGKQTSGYQCNMLTPACTAVKGSGIPAFSYAGDGSFADQFGTKHFVFRTSKGVLVMLADNTLSATTPSDFGTFMFARNGPVEQNFVEDSFQQRLDITFSSAVTGASAISSIGSNDRFITKIDSQANTITQKRVGTCLTDTVRIGKPFPQMVQRDAGSFKNCAEMDTVMQPFYALAHSGIGFAPYVSGNGGAAFSIVLPTLASDNAKSYLEQTLGTSAGGYRFLYALPIGPATTATPTPAMNHAFNAGGVKNTSLGSATGSTYLNLSKTLLPYSTLPTAVWLRDGYLYAANQVDSNNLYRSDGTKVYFDKTGLALNIPNAGGPRTSITFTDQVFLAKPLTLSGAVNSAPPMLARDSLYTSLLATTVLWDSAKLAQGWLGGSVATRWMSVRMTDSISVTDCSSSSVANVASIETCLGASGTASTLEQLFATTVSADSRSYSIADGSIRQIQGARVWLSNTPIGGVSTNINGTTSLAYYGPVTYRIWFELGGKIYKGTFIAANTQIRTGGDLNTATDMTVRYSEPALNTLKAAFLY